VCGSWDRTVRGCLRGLLHVGVRQQARQKQKQKRLVLQDSVQAARKAATCLCLHDVLRHNAARFEEAVQK
jgi:hypothetical protein